jgi:hypothetical protein
MHLSFFVGASGGINDLEAADDKLICRFGWLWVREALGDLL